MGPLSLVEGSSLSQRVPLNYTLLRIIINHSEYCLLFILILPYSLKLVCSEILADFNMVARYSIIYYYIRTLYIRKEEFWLNLIWQFEV